MELEKTKAPEESPEITFTVAELQEAVECYELLDQSEVEKAYQSMLAVPAFGLKVAKALQFAAKMATQKKMGTDRILDAAVVPAFLIGLLVGFGRKLESDLLETPSFDDQMEMMERFIGEEVEIHYVSYGKPQWAGGVLKRVEPYMLLATTNESIPFIGSGCAIRQVEVVSKSWKRTVYYNPKVLRYDIRDEAEVEKFKTATWGTLPPLKKKS